MIYADEKTLGMPANHQRRSRRVRIKCIRRGYSATDHHPRHPALWPACSGETVARINDEVGTITGAAFETAAQSIRTVLYHLYSDPEMLRRLRAEVAGTRKVGESHINVSVLEQLPYLTGIIREGLRLSPGLATRLARVAPDLDLSDIRPMEHPCGDTCWYDRYVMQLGKRTGNYRGIVLC